jgi:hypothetical protein
MTQPKIRIKGEKNQQNKIRNWPTETSAIRLSFNGNYAHHVYRKKMTLKLTIGTVKGYISSLKRSQTKNEKIVTEV